jgi:F-type H+-transporting ATPase subunit epsilon
MKTFNLKLISPTGIKYEAEANSVFLPTPDGEIEVLPDHMPLIALLSPGEISIKLDDKTEFLSTDGGLVEINSNIVKIIADAAESADSLDEFKILEAKKAAEERLANAKDNVEFADAAAHLEKQLARLSVITKHKHRH